MYFYSVKMRKQSDGSEFTFECEAASSDEAEAIANDEHQSAIAVDVELS